MQDYERMINHFFHHFNVTITSQYNEKKHYISIKECYQYINILSNYSTLMVFLEEHVTGLVDAEFQRLNEDVRNVSLVDKLDLLAMDCI